MDLSSPQEKSATELLSYFAQGFKRYWKIAIAPAIILFCLTIMISYTIPDYYTSDALLFIQPPRVNSKILDTSAGTGDKEETREWLEALVQEILSRPRLRAIIERFELYPSLRGQRGLELAVQKFRRKVSLKPMTSPTGVELMQTFRLSFMHQDSKMAFDVTKALSDLFVEESVLEKRSEMQGTEEFIDAQLREARKELEVTEQRVKEFVVKNAGQLPDQQISMQARLELMRTRLTNNAQMINASTIRRSGLIAELSDAEREAAYMPVNPDRVDSSDPGDSLAQLEAALVVLQSKYSAEHPDVANTKARIAALKQQVGSGTGHRTRSVANPTRMSSIRRAKNAINELEAELTSLKQEAEQLKTDITKLEESIATAPIQEQELIKIKRDYENKKKNYEQLLAAKDEAALRNSLVRSQKDTQFKIVEPAEMAAMPSGPKRVLIAIGGAVSSVVVFFGLTFGLFFLNTSFKTRDELEEQTGLSILGIIPPMPTSDAILQEKRVFRASFIASVCSLVCGCVIIYSVLHYVVV